MDAVKKKNIVTTFRHLRGLRGAEENYTTTDALWTIYFTHYDQPKQQLLPEIFISKRHN